MSAPKKIDRSDAIGVFWPEEGPHTAESVIGAGAGIRELWRYLGHATLVPTTEALADPADVYLAIGNLRTAANSAEQVLRQLERWAAWLLTVPGLSHDDSSRYAKHGVDIAADCVIDAQTALRAAANHMVTVGTDLEKVSAALSHIYLDIDSSDEGGA
ncbi:hypothetical protein [Nocardia wallacei]|uniref:hypothetical protein n=1 Tax=Nocardia wallacei TaxID=480035 RepID=UPI002458172F|nr:hypothetical protein [Nocardia wallacei]